MKRKKQDKYKKQQDKYQNHQEDQPGSKYCFAAGDMKVECEDDMVSFPFRMFIRKMKHNLSKIFLHVLTPLPSRTTHQQTGLAPPEKWRRVLTVKPTGWPTMEWRKILMEWQEVGDFWLGLVWHWAGGGCVTLSKSEAAKMGWRKPSGERWNRRRFRSKELVDIVGRPWSAGEYALFNFSRSLLTKFKSWQGHCQQVRTLPTSANQGKKVKAAKSILAIKYFANKTLSRCYVECRA